ncbi:hypothetical protein BHE74_00037613 [Ensete ventricosum]|nr:hypothetical protein BHE74_00037613 [Ensete ventricosum]
MRTSKLGRMYSAQRLGWPSSSYGSTLATKLHGAQGMIEATGELDCSSAHIRLREPGKSEDKADQTNMATKEAKENRIGTSPTVE